MGSGFTPLLAVVREGGLVTVMSVGDHERGAAADDQIDQWLSLLRKNGPDRWLLRKLQRYGVTVYRRDLERLLAYGDIAAVGDACPGLYVQASDVLYDREMGLNVEGAPGDPASLFQ